MSSLSVTDILMVRRAREMYPAYSYEEISSLYFRAHLWWGCFKGLPAPENEPAEFRAARYMTALHVMADQPHTKAGYWRAATAILSLHAEYI